MVEQFPYLAVHDYGHGAVAMWIYASDKESIQSKLHAPSWAIYEKDDSTRPRWTDEDEFHSTSLDAPSEQLSKQIYVCEKKSEGKNSTIIRVKTWRGYQYREIWARNDAEVFSRYPKFESMILKPMTPAILKKMGTSDIDVPDDFLRRYSRTD